MRKGKLKKKFRLIKEQVVKQWWVYLLLGVLLVGGLFVRVYRVGDLLGFYYDQGRDGLVIWDLWHEGRFFLIGPTTGIEGIFLGPLYYYLIAPFYILTGGNPAGPAIFLGATTMGAAYLLFWLGKRYFSWRVGLVATLIFSFSYYLVWASRWLSNPTPLLLTACLMLVGLGQVIEGRKWGWMLAVGAASAGLQFEAASATFFFPALAVFLIWQRRKLDWRVVLGSGVIFGVFLLPQVIFNFRHDGILLAAFKRFLLEEGSFRSGGMWELASERLKFYEGVFGSKLLPGYMEAAAWFLLLGLAGIFGAKKKKAGGEFLVTLGLFWAVPLVLLLFYQGNHGYVWDYYFTGVYPIFVLLFAVGLSGWGRRWWGLIGVLVFLGFFIKDNGVSLRNYLSAGVDGETHITLGNMKQAVGWMFEDVGELKFNADTYVPPVIPYSYDYLYLWMGTEKYGRLPEEGRVELLYTLYEVDPPHPERLDAWMERQEGIGKVEEEVRFGGVRVQKRTRI